MGRQTFQQKRGRDFEYAVGNLLSVYGVPYIRIDNYRCFKCGQVQNGKAKGFPDFFCYTIDTYIECKTGTNKLSKEQRKFRDEVTAAGKTFIELRDTVDELLDYLKVKGY